MTKMTKMPKMTRKVNIPKAVGEQCWLATVGRKYESNQRQ